jgi:hypothetical protein
VLRGDFAGRRRKKIRQARKFFVCGRSVCETQGLPAEDRFAAGDQEALRKDPKTYVKATLREGTQTLTDVGVRLKGSGSFQGIEKKPSLAIKFNEFVSAQKFHGQSKVLLNNSHQDPSYLCEAIGGEVFRAAGVPAARVAFARVELNGRDVGLYVMVEAANRDFLSQHFKKSKGNLYEGANLDVTDKLEKDSGDASTDQADLKALASATKEADLAQRWRKLSALLDMDRFISFAAAEVLTWHHDGYSMDRNNYRIYHDPASGQMVFLPHGLDSLFTDPDGPLTPEWKGLVAKAVFDMPEGQRLYRDRMAKLLADSCAVDKLHARVNDLAAAIRPAVGEHDSSAVKAFDAAVGQLRNRIAQRLSFLSERVKAAAPK